MEYQASVTTSEAFLTATAGSGSKSILAPLDRANCFDQGIADIAAGPEPCHLPPGNRADDFLECHDVSHDLAGMRRIGQTIDYRNRGVLGKKPNRGRIEGSDHDNVGIS